MHKQNPFLYGCIVSAEHFCPRKRLEKRLAALVRSGQNVAVTGPRRVGKSSLIHRVAGEIRGSTLIYVDLWGIRTMSDLVRRCVQALDVIEDKAGLLQRIARALPGLTVTMGLDPVTGSPTMTPTLSTRRKTAPESVAQIARLWQSLHEGSRRLIIALDEFQDLMAMEEADQVLGLLRKEIQLLGKIPFCFCGSVRNDMWKLFADDRGAFYKSASMLEVTDDDFDDWHGFLRGHFNASALKISDETLGELIRLADGSPGDTQQLCAAVWEGAQSRATRTVCSEHVRDALLQVFADERKGYEQIVGDITGQQLAVLRAIATLDGRSIQSAEFLAVADIAHASSSKAAATRLINRRILQETPDGLKFSNPFFRAWLLHVGY
ncbi:MAG: orc1/cdc6 family replication initiation protein [Kiritimatiellae bacterium]|nr:orc1/cdc6 family replication initiation protein [Kiritimatiellia bacterium]